MNETANETSYVYTRPPADPDWYKVCLNVVFFVVGFVGNICLIYISLRYKSMRSVPNYLLTNLALVDLVFICILMPNEVFFSLNLRIQKYDFYKTEASCSIYHYFKIVFLGVSVFTLTGLSVDRYMAVSRAMSFRESRGGRRRLFFVVLGIVVIWLLALAIAVPEYFNAALWGNGYCRTNVFGDLYEPYTYMAVVVFLVIPTGIISASYCCTTRHLIRSNNLVPSQGCPAQVSQRQRRQRLRLAIAIIVIVLVFVVTWGLHYGLELAFIADNGIKRSPAWQVLSKVSYVLVRVNAVINPIVLFVVSSAHRRYFRLSFCGCCQPSRAKDGPERGRRYTKNTSITINSSADSKGYRASTDPNRVVVGDHRV